MNDKDISLLQILKIKNSWLAPHRNSFASPGLYLSQNSVLFIGIIFCWGQQGYHTLLIIMHDPQTPLPSLSVCLRQNFWMLTHWPSRKRISFTKTYMWCLCLDDPCGLTVYLVVRYLSLTTAPLSLICSLLCITGTGRLQTAFPNPLPAGLTMGFIKVRHVQNKNNNNLFFFLRQQFHFRIQTLAAQHHSSSFSTGHATSVTL